MPIRIYEYSTLLPIGKNESELSILVKKKKEQSNSAYNSFISGIKTRWGHQKKRIKGKKKGTCTIFNDMD